MMEGLLIFLGIVIFIFLIVSVKQIGEYERGLKFTYGKFSKILEPGWHIILPVFQSFRKIDIRRQYV